MSDQQQTPLDNERYFRGYGSTPITPTWEQAIVVPRTTPAPAVAPLPVLRGAPAAQPAENYHPLFAPFERSSSNFGLVMACLASLCRGMYYPDSGNAWFRRVCEKINQREVLLNVSGNVLANQYKFSTDNAALPRVGIFKPNGLGTVLAVAGITSTQTWNGQIAWDSLVETSVLQDYLDHNVQVGNALWTKAQALYTAIRADFGGLGSDKVIVTGHSMGGVVAAYLARLLAKDFPGKVAYVMTFGSPKPGDSHFGDSKSWNSGLVLPFYRITHETDPANALPLFSNRTPWRHVMMSYWNIRSGGIITRDLSGWENPVWQTLLYTTQRTWGTIQNPYGELTTPYLEMFLRATRQLAGVQKYSVHMLKEYLVRLSFWLSKALTDRNTQYADVAGLVDLKGRMDALPSEGL